MSRFEEQITVDVPVRGVDGWRGEIHGDEVRPAPADAALPGARR